MLLDNPHQPLHKDVILVRADVVVVLVSVGPIESPSRLSGIKEIDAALPTFLSVILWRVKLVRYLLIKLNNLLIMPY